MDGLVEQGGGGCHSHQSVFVVSLSFPLFGSPFWCLPVHSIVCLSILLSLGVKVGTENPSSSTLIFSDRIFEYSSILHLLKIAHQPP